MRSKRGAAILAAVSAVLLAVSLGYFALTPGAWDSLGNDVFDSGLLQTTAVEPDAGSAAAPKDKESTEQVPAEEGSEADKTPTANTDTASNAGANDAGGDTEANTGSGKAGGNAEVNVSLNKVGGNAASSTSSGSGASGAAPSAPSTSTSSASGKASGNSADSGGSTGTGQSAGAGTNSSSSASDSSAAPPDPSATDPTPAPAPAPTVTVSVSVSSSAVGSPVSASGTYTFDKGATAYDALCALGLSINASSTSMGVYVAAIGGLAEKEHGATSGWMYTVNGASPNYSASGYKLQDGDSVSWYYVTG